jgi:hypothetical protein
MRLALLACTVIAVLALPACAEQDVYLDPALRGIEVYLPRGLYPQTPYFSAYQVDLIHREALAVHDKIRHRFKYRYATWKGTWSSGVAPFAGEPYERLAELGTAILPLLIEKLLEDEEAPALVAYDHIAPMEFFVQSDPADTTPAPLALRARALKTIRRYLDLARKKTYRRTD